jgi:two-component sensor histidine kinase
LSLIAAVALLPAPGTIIYNETVFRQVRGQEAQQSAFRTAELVSLEIDRIISGSGGILAAMARAPVVRNFREQDCAPYLLDLAIDLPQFNAIAAIDRDGNLRCRSTAASVTTGFETRPYFQAVMRDRVFSVGEYTKSANDQSEVLPLAVPINDAQGEIIGVLVAGLNLDWLGTRLRQRQFPANSSLTIADRNGTILAREPLPERFVGTRIPDSFQHLVNASAPGTLELTSQDGTQRVQGYFPTTMPPFGLYVSAGISKTDAFQSINEATQRNLLLAALSAIVAFAVAMLVARKLVLQPVHRLQTTIDAWRAGNTGARTGMHPQQDEISAVGASVDAFLNELNFAREERLATDEKRELLSQELQHRIKNLLATVQAIAVQSFGRDRNAEDLQSFNQRLTAMGKAQAILVGQNWQQADITEVVASSTSLFDAPERFSISGPNLQINGAAAMTLSMALHELCTNAVKYGALSNSGGHVVVIWNVQDQPESTFYLIWEERGGPSVAEPTKVGFGTRMIETILAREIGGTVRLNYAASGLTCLCTAPLASILVSA